MTTITLPMPPSTNSIWRAVKGRNIMSEEYRAWKIEAGQTLNAQRPEKHSGRVHVSIVLCAGDNRRRDLDNRLKAPLDLIKAHGVIADDDSRYVRRLTAEWADEGPECVVTITPITPSQPRASLTHASAAVTTGEGLNSSLGSSSVEPQLPSPGNAPEPESRSTVSRPSGSGDFLETMK